MKPVRGEPGVFVTSSGSKIKIVEWREDDKYDAVDHAAGAIGAGTTRNFFRDLSNKNKVDTNFTTPRRIAGGEEMIIDRIGVQVMSAFGDTEADPSDIKKVAESAFLEFKINSFLVAEGPLVKYPSGYGIQGQTTQNDQGVVGIGVPSTAAQAKLRREQFINEDNDLEATVKFEDRKWRDGGSSNMPTLTRILAYRLYLHGLVRSAATKG